MLDDFLCTLNPEEITDEEIFKEHGPGISINEKYGIFEEDYE